VKIRFLDAFVYSLKNQVEYIALDKPNAAKKFKLKILSTLKTLPKFPYQNRKSIYFDDDCIRDLIIMGYTVVYKIDQAKDEIVVFGMRKQQNDIK
jgi:plasmid stabilization system protein ParE